MKSYPYQITEQSVVLMKGGKRFIAHRHHPNFRKIVDCIKDGRFANVERLFKVSDRIEKVMDITIKGNRLFYKGHELHNTIVDRIVTCMKENLPYKPLARFLSKLMQNPDEQARTSLYSYLELHKLPWTDSGNVIGVKAIQSNWTDKFSGKIKYKLNVPTSMNRKDVCRGLDECAGAGLHVGSAQYVEGYGNGDDIYILVEFNPKDVVVVPKEGGFGKIRLCKFTPRQVIKRENLNFVSDYAPNNDQYKEVEKLDTRANHLHQRRDSKGRFVAA